MAKLSKMKLDAAAETSGVWTDFAAGIRLKIARLGNPQYREYMRKLGRPHQVQIAHGTIDDKIVEEMSREAVAHTILLDWENVEHDDGTPWKYTPDDGERIFNDPAYYDLFQFVVAYASKSEHYRAEYLQEAAGNSSVVSDGISSGDSF